MSSSSSPTAPVVNRKRSVRAASSAEADAAPYGVFVSMAEAATTPTLAALVASRQQLVANVREAVPWSSLPSRPVFNINIASSSPRPATQTSGVNATVATSVAATVESFYRSAVNSRLNQHLTGVKSSLFPNMQFQVPVRVIYINGFKQIRAWLDEAVDADARKRPLVGLSVACAPGIFMTPVVSVLEACNATCNPTPLHRRWIAGIAPRGVREIIFGIGLNQLSDEFAAHTRPYVAAPWLQTALGSIAAGVVSGYLSHVPHNLSAMKLMAPRDSYSRLMGRLIDTAATRVPKWVPATLRRPTAAALALLAPKGLHIRTAQVVGSFVILNGIINLLTGPATSPNNIMCQNDQEQQD